MHINKDRIVRNYGETSENGTFQLVLKDDKVVKGNVVYLDKHDLKSMCMADCTKVEDGWLYVFQYYPNLSQKDKEKGWVLGYDLKSLPKDRTIKSIGEDARKTGNVYWDSSLGGQKPEILDLGGDRNKEYADYVIIDISSDES